MAKDDELKMEGIVIKAHSTAEFEVQLENGATVRATLAGKMKVNRIRLLPGDKVDVSLSMYDLTRGRITYRR